MALAILEEAIERLREGVGTGEVCIRFGCLAGTLTNVSIADPHCSNSLSRK